MNREKVNNTHIHNLESETIEVTPEDGFVKQKYLHPAGSLDQEDNITYRKGYAKTKAFTTNDPRLTRTFTYAICAVFLVIGVFMLMVGKTMFGIVFTAVSLFAFVKSKKSIDVVAKKFEEQGKDVIIDSKEDAQQLVGEISELAKDAFEESARYTYTKQNYKGFLKTAIPMYVIISIIMCTFGFLANAILGCIVLILTMITGVLFFFIMNKICKY